MTVPVESLRVESRFEQCIFSQDELKDALEPTQPPSTEASYRWSRISLYCRAHFDTVVRTSKIALYAIAVASTVAGIVATSPMSFVLSGIAFTLAEVLSKVELFTKTNVDKDKDLKELTFVQIFKKSLFSSRDAKKTDEEKGDKPKESLEGLEDNQIILGTLDRVEREIRFPELCDLAIEKGSEARREEHRQEVSD